MKKLFFGIIVGFILGSVVTVYSIPTKTESSNQIAQSAVGYGYNGTSLVTLPTDTNGTVIVQ